MRSRNLLLMVIALAVVSCAKKKDDTASTDSDEATSNISESAMSEAAQHSTSSEGATSPSLLSLDDISEDIQAMDFVDPKDILHPKAACTFSAARSNCASNVNTLDWGGCTVGTATLTGGWTETWSSGFCADGSKPTILTNGNSVTRTSPSGQVLTFLSGAKITTDTVAHQTYDSTNIPGTGVTTTMSGGTRTIVINGIHRVMTGPLGRTWFNHTITSSGITVTGTRAAGTRTVSGTSTMYHNLASYKATHTFNTVTWGSSSCCYPTSGSISSTLTGTGRSGSVSLTFTSTCGTATFVDTNSSSSTVTLTQCN